jgi:hypothetical protein
MISHAIPKDTSQSLFVAETPKRPFHSAIPKWDVLERNLLLNFHGFRLKRDGPRPIGH